MTFRSRTVEKRNRRRSSHSSDARRTLFLNLGFVMAIIGALTILGGVMFANWYSDHWAAVASVSGHHISKDDVRSRAAVLQARYQQQKNAITQLQNRGLITSDEASTQTSTIDTNMQQSNLMNEALTELQQEIVLQQYADQNGISISDSQVQAAITKDGTTPERRNVKVIAVAPVAADGQTVPTDADVQAAQKKAQGYLDEIKGGKKWDDVATEANVTYQAQPSGSLGLVTQDNSQMDPELTADVFGLKAANDITPIVHSPDGLFRFATITTIVPQSSASNWQQTLQDSGAGGDAVKSWAKGQALRDAVKAKFTKDNIASDTLQKQVLDIFVPAPNGTGSEVKSRLAVYSPNKDPRAATSLAATDPAWNDAKKRADEAYAKLKNADPAAFEAEAKNGDYKEIAQIKGDLPYVTQDVFGQSYLNMAEVGSALWAPNLKLDQVLPPVKTAVGYVIAQYAGSRPDPASRILDAQMQLNSGADFSTVAKSVSQAADATTGGNLGWVARYQLDPAIEKAIFATPVGGITPTIQTSNGYYIYKVIGEQKRTASDATQKALLDANAFNNWLIALQAKSSTWQDSAGISALSSAAAS